MTINNKMINDVTNYYEEKLKKHGPTSRGVDWNSRESQELRFSQLIKVFENHNERFTILDYGCGYGALLDYMNQYSHEFDFTGFDSSEEMIDQAKKLHPDSKWIYNGDNLQQVDFVIASGIFNVSFNYKADEWWQYILETLNHFNDLSIKGFSFNILTKYSDREYMKDDLFYADPVILFDWCKKEFSKYVALLHDYPLYEFTILVKKEN